jgi:hypothetical protein
MRLEKRRLVSLFLTLLMTAAFCMGYPPAKASNNTDPEIYSDKQTVLKGSPFQAVFYFKHAYYSSTYNIVIDVSNTNGAISLGKKSFSSKSDEIDKENGEVNTDSSKSSDDDDSSYKYDYKLVIPEKYMKRAGDGAGTLKFTIRYYDSNGSKMGTYLVQKTIFDPTGTNSTEQNGRLQLQSYRMDHSPVREGEKFNLIFTVKNNGTSACNNIMSVLDPSTAEGISIQGVSDTQYIESIASGQSATITYPMTCLSKMVTGNYTVSLILSADELSKSLTSKIFIPVIGTKADKDTASNNNESKPLIIIESYDYGGKPVMGGKEFNLAMHFKNTNTSTQIENLKITVSSVAGTDDKSVAGAFTPAKSSNTFFIPKVAPGSSFAEQIALIPKADATPNSYGVTVAFTYEAVLDGKREAIEANEIISIPLTQSDRFEANEAELQGPVSMGDVGQLNINYVNKGKSKIFNLSVKLEGNFSTESANTYIGNVESGAGDTFQAALNPKEEGTLTGKATFSYEDANGNVKNLIKSFSCQVIAQQDNGEGLGSEPGSSPNASKTPPLWMILAGAGGAIVMAIIVFVIIHKKRKAKKQKMLEESDDYDEAS